MRYPRESSPRSVAAGRPVASSDHRTGRRWLRRAAILIVATGLLAAAPAIAVIQPWEPSIGRPDVAAPVASDATSVATSARDALAVLHRPQTAEDRSTATPLLRTFDTEVDGVKLDDIRRLADGWALVPVKTVKAADRSEGEQLCITNGAIISCAAATSVDRRGVGFVSAGEGGTTHTGLVPDRVAGVRFAPSVGSPVKVPVRSNFYSLRVGARQPGRLIPAPKGYDGPAMIPGPPMPIDGTLEWLDEKGRVVGPAGSG